MATAELARELGAGEIAHPVSVRAALGLDHEDGALISLAQELS